MYKGVSRWCRWWVTMSEATDRLRRMQTKDLGAAWAM